MPVISFYSFILSSSLHYSSLISSRQLINKYLGKIGTWSSKLVGCGMIVLVPHYCFILQSMKLFSHLFFFFMLFTPLNKCLCFSLRFIIIDFEPKHWKYCPINLSGLSIWQLLQLTPNIFIAILFLCVFMLQRFEIYSKK